MGFISKLLGEEEPRQPYARARGKFLFYRHDCPFCRIALTALAEIESNEPLALDPNRKVRLIDVDLDREMTLWLSNILERKNGNSEIHVPVLYIDGIIKEGIIANPAAFKLNDYRDVRTYEVGLRQLLRLPQRS